MYTVFLLVTFLQITFAQLTESGSQSWLQVNSCSGRFCYVSADFELEDRQVLSMPIDSYNHTLVISTELRDTFVYHSLVYGYDFTLPYCELDGLCKTNCLVKNNQTYRCYVADQFTVYAVLNSYDVDRLETCIHDSCSEHDVRFGAETDYGAIKYSRSSRVTHQFPGQYVVIPRDWPFAVPMLCDVNTVAGVRDPLKLGYFKTANANFQEPLLQDAAYLTHGSLPYNVKLIPESPFMSCGGAYCYDNYGTDVTEVNDANGVFHCVRDCVQTICNGTGRFVLYDWSGNYYYDKVHNGTFHVNTGNAYLTLSLDYGPQFMPLKTTCFSNLVFISEGFRSESLGLKTIVMKIQATKDTDYFTMYYGSKNSGVAAGSLSSGWWTTNIVQSFTFGQVSFATKANPMSYPLSSAYQSGPGVLTHEYVNLNPNSLGSLCWSVHVGDYQGPGAIEVFITFKALNNTADQDYVLFVTANDVTLPNYVVKPGGQFVDINLRPSGVLPLKNSMNQYCLWSTGAKNVNTSLVLNETIKLVPTLYMYGNVTQDFGQFRVNFTYPWGSGGYARVSDPFVTASHTSYSLLVSNQNEIFKNCSLLDMQFVSEDLKRGVATLSQDVNLVARDSVGSERHHVALTNYPLLMGVNSSCEVITLVRTNADGKLLTLALKVVDQCLNSTPILVVSFDTTCELITSSINVEIYDYIYRCDELPEAMIVRVPQAEGPDHFNVFHLDLVTETCGLKCKAGNLIDTVDKYKTWFYVILTSFAVAGFIMVIAPAIATLSALWMCFRWLWWFVKKFFQAVFASMRYIKLKFTAKAVAKIDDVREVIKKQKKRKPVGGRIKLSPITGSMVVMCLMIPCAQSCDSLLLGVSNITSCFNQKCSLNTQILDTLPLIVGAEACYTIHNVKTLLGVEATKPVTIRVKVEETAIVYDTQWLYYTGATTLSNKVHCECPDGSSHHCTNDVHPSDISQDNALYHSFTGTRAGCPVIYSIGDGHYCASIQPRSDFAVGVHKLLNPKRTTKFRITVDGDLARVDQTVIWVGSQEKTTQLDSTTRFSIVGAYSEQLPTLESTYLLRSQTNAWLYSNMNGQSSHLPTLHGWLQSQDRSAGIYDKYLLENVVRTSATHCHSAQASIDADVANLAAVLVQDYAADKVVGHYGTPVLVGYGLSTNFSVKTHVGSNLLYSLSVPPSLVTVQMSEACPVLVRWWQEDSHVGDTTSNVVFELRSTCGSGKVSITLVDKVNVVSSSDVLTIIDGLANVSVPIEMTAFTGSARVVFTTLTKTLNTTLKLVAKTQLVAPENQVTTDDVGGNGSSTCWALCGVLSTSGLDSFLPSFLKPTGITAYVYLAIEVILYSAVVITAVWFARKLWLQRKLKTKTQ